MSSLCALRHGASAQQDKVFRSFEEVCAVLLQAMAPVIKVTYEPWHGNPGPG